MMTEQPFLPLFFNLEDGEIWEQLQKLPPEKRAETVKQALHEFFQAHSDFQTENIISSLPKPPVPVLSSLSETERTEESSVLNGKEFASNDDEQGEEQIFIEAVPENELSFESLFEAKPQEIKLDPLKNLLSVIGEEDDEEVVRLLLSDKKSKTELKPEIERKEPKKHIDNNEVLLRTEAMASGGGLAYLLNNVIGEEEDEEVLHFFQNIAEQKEK